LIANQDDLQKAIAYNFTNADLLTAALTHRSVGRGNNERLEFLGDAILGMVIADSLYKQFPEASEGDLSRMRARLVRGESLTALAQKISLGDYLYLGQGELKSGGFRRASILADAYEALLGAIYLDSDIQQCRQFILHQFSQLLAEISPAGAQKDAKTLLQESLQAKQMPLPEYEIIATAGQAHAQVFTVECRVQGYEPVSASAPSRRKAEQAAAAKLLEGMNNA
jgi:ribonuclease-3